jgi:hypothetical protein
MLLNAGDLISKHTYFCCDKCSEDNGDIKQHYIFAEKRVCVSCQHISVRPDISFTRGHHTVLKQKSFVSIW